MTKDLEPTPEGSPAERKAYETPALEHLGKVADLTHGLIGAGSDAIALGSQ